MRRNIIAILFALAAVLAVGLPASVSAQTQPQPVFTAEKTSGSLYPIALGIGAITGVLVYNLASAGLLSLPFLTTGTAPAITVSATDALLATNRLTTVAAAVVGAWVFNWLYGY